jgi:superfamily II DNA or RNA helicase
MSELPELFDHQRNFLDDIEGLNGRARVCLYFKTGAGKSLTAMLGMQQLGYTEVLVIAPPSTHFQWVALGWELNMAVEVMSHAKFRMKDTKLSRTRAIIADEFHLFGGQKGQGWQKLDKLAQHLEAPLFLLSATPNYNDAERCYCIQHVLDPLSCRGGYLQFIYQNCKTEQNPFGLEPKVTGFLNYPDAASFLADLPGVYYLPDDLVYTIQDIPYREHADWMLTEYMYNRRKHRMVASIIELAHTVRYQGLVDEHGYLHPEVYNYVIDSRMATGTLLIYANHATVAEAVARSFDRDGQKYAVITGLTPKWKKEAILQEFRDGQHNVLIGTATLATGTDGLDRVCDTLLILDDTDDDALRRQLIGRIMPRGDFVSTADKQVFRLVPI